ncbi:MAG: helix-turn-helix domain-containing protein [Eubacterium sp.]|nr:helix-turn-helix domain-containing protein [Eubacterium sp.]
MTIDEINDLRDQYPQIISAAQMQKICHISDNKCKYLLEEGIVPSIDYHRRAKRFKIRLDDVIDYLQKREMDADYGCPPKGYYSALQINKRKRWIIRQKVLSEEEKKIVRDYYEKQIESWPDVLTPWWAARLLGWTTSNIVKVCREKKLKAFHVGRGRSLKIPKEYLIDYLVSEDYRCRKCHFTREQLEHEEKLEKLLVSYNLTVENSDGDRMVNRFEESSDGNHYLSADEINNIKNQYPSYVSGQQMCQICDIKMPECKYLLENGIVPCVDYHRRRHRFKIRLDDVIDFLQKRAAGVELRRSPTEYMIQNINYEKSPLRIRRKNLSEKEQSVVRAYYEEQTISWPDVIKTDMVCSLLGCKGDIVARLCRQQKLKAFYIGKGSALNIPKEYLLDYLVSWEHRCGRKFTPKEKEHEEKLEKLLKTQCPVSETEELSEQEQNCDNEHLQSNVQQMEEASYSLEESTLPEKQITDTENRFGEVFVSEKENEVVNEDVDVVVAETVFMSEDSTADEMIPQNDRKKNDMKIDAIEDLRDQYPPYISENQMYKICHISKRTCRYLLGNGIVPCIDNHKKTHRYKIRIDDVIEYLYKRESGAELKRPPAGYYKSQKNDESSLLIREKLLSDEAQEIVRSYYEKQTEGWPDVMRIWWVSRLLGCTVTTVSKLCQDQKLKAFKIGGTYKVPKDSLIDYLVSEEYRCRKKNTPKQLEHEEKLEKMLRVQRQVNESMPDPELGSDDTLSVYNDCEEVPQILEEHAPVNQSTSDSETDSDAAILMKLLKNPEAAGLLKALVKVMDK